MKHLIEHSKTLRKTRIQFHDRNLRKAKRVIGYQPKKKKRTKTHHAVLFIGEGHVVDRHSFSPSIILKSL